jgi:hypothetical protein
MAVIRATSNNGVIKTQVSTKENTQVKKVIVGTPIRRVSASINIPEDFKVSLVAGDGKTAGALLTFNEETGQFEPLLTLGNNVVSDGGSF